MRSRTVTGSVKLIVTSSEDPASMNIRSRLLEKTGWDEGRIFGSHPTFIKDDFLMIQVDKIHLEEDFVDRRVSDELQERVDVTIFASRHRAESRIPTLTVHPIGNFSAAEFGGRPGTLCKASPQFMTSALRNLSIKGQGLGFNISFETTHHGPSMEGPVFYIEIGSYEELWGREDAADAIAESIASIRDDGHPVMICVGGGHYAPRFTEVALSRKIAIGHMAANYALDSLDENMICQMAEKSDSAKKVYFHKKGMAKPAYRQLRERFASFGLEEISSNDLETL